MGTKNNPGQFDCYAAAHPDEPIFVLLGRDRHAAGLVELWSILRKLEGEDPAKVAEAIALKVAIDGYRDELGHDPQQDRERFWATLHNLIAAIERG